MCPSADYAVPHHATDVLPLMAACCGCPVLHETHPNLSSTAVTSTLGEKGGDRLPIYTAMCPEGTYVTGFTVLEDKAIVPETSVIAAISPLCGPSGKIAPSTGLSGYPKDPANAQIISVKSLAGYTAINLSTGDLIDVVKLVAVNANDSVSFGGKGNPNVDKKRIACRPGWRISSIAGRTVKPFGSSDSYIVSLGLRCVKAQNDAAVASAEQSG